MPHHQMYSNVIPKTPVDISMEAYIGFIWVLCLMACQPSWVI